MPIAEIQLPDGRLAEIDFPEGMGREQVASQVLASFGGQSFTPEAPVNDVVMPEPFTEESFAADVAARKEQKKREGTAQRITDPIPFVGGVVRGAEKVGEAGAEILARGIDAIAGLGGVDSGLAESFAEQSKLRESQFEKRKGELSGLGEFVGGAVAGGGVPTAGAIGPSLGKALAVGVPLTTLTTPVENKDLTNKEFVVEKAKQAGLSLATMGVLEGGARTLSKLSKTGIAQKARSMFGEAAETPQVSEEVTKIIPTSREIKEQASALYAAASEEGGSVAPQKVSKFFDDVIDGLPKDALANKRFQGSPASEAIDEMVDLASSGQMTLDGVDAIDKQLTMRARNAFTSGDDASQKIIKDVQSDFRTMVSKEGEAFGKNRAAVDLWSKAKRLEQIEEIIENSMRQRNPITSMQAGFKALLKNKKRRQGFTAKEKRFLDRASKDDALQDRLRTFGSRLVGIFGLSSGNIGQGLALETAATASRNLATSLQTKLGDDVRRVVATGQVPIQRVISPIDTAVRQQTTREVAGTDLFPKSEIESQSFEEALQSFGEDERVRNLINQEQNFNQFQGVQKPQAQSQGSGDFKSQLIQAESGGDPNAKAKTSTASGLFQITDPTWESLVNRYGAQEGVSREDRGNLEAEEKMLDRLVQENTQSFQKSFKRKPNNTELYAMHFLGVGNGKRIVKLKDKSPNLKASDVFKAASKTNRPIFYKNNGRGEKRTIQEVYEILKRKVS